MKKIFLVTTKSRSKYEVELVQHFLGRPKWTIKRKGKKEKIRAISHHKDFLGASKDMDPNQFQKKLIEGNFIFFGKSGRTSRINKIREVA